MLVELGVKEKKTSETTKRKLYKLFAVKHKVKESLPLFSNFQYVNLQLQKQAYHFNDKMSACSWSWELRRRRLERPQRENRTNCLLSNTKLKSNCLCSVIFNMWTCSLKNRLTISVIKCLRARGAESWGEEDLRAHKEKTVRIVCCQTQSWKVIASVQ